MHGVIGAEWLCHQETINVLFLGVEPWVLKPKPISLDKIWDIALRSSRQAKSIRATKLGTLKDGSHRL
jgi:hypothetical protein